MGVRKLSGLDASFLYLETPEQPMHIGSLCLLAPPEGGAAGYVDRVRAHLAERMHLAPLLQQRLQLMPLDLGHPLLVPDPAVDLDWHVRRVRLKARHNSLRHLRDFVASTHAEPLDRSRPLWQFTVIEGLVDGSIGFYSKIHHAVLDGQAGVALAQALLDPTPEARAVPVGPAARSLRISRRRMLGSLLGSSLGQYAKVVRALPEAVRVAARAVGSRLRELPGLLPELRSRLAPRTCFNRQIGVERRFLTQSLPLAAFKARARELSATVNDLLLLYVGEALRRYLEAVGEAPDRDLVAAVPISLRAQGDQSASNQVTMLPCTLASDGEDLGARLARIQVQMEELKSGTKSYPHLIPTDYPSLGAPWLVGGLVQLATRTRLVEALPVPVNVVVSNVPGPPVPLYLAGAKLLAYYPVSIVVHGLGINVTVHSYAGSLDIGVIAAASAVTDVRKLEQSFQSAWEWLAGKTTRARRARRSAAGS